MAEIPKPEHLVLPVTYRCNARCAMCNLGRDHGEEITAGTIDRLTADQDALSELAVVNITGGEPFLHRRLEEICFTLAERVPSLRLIGFSTNGLLPERIHGVMRNLAENLPGRDLKLGIEISLDGPAEVHDRVRGVPGAYEKAMAAFRALQKLHKSDPRLAEIGFGCNVNRLTVDHLERTLSIAGDLGARVTFTPAVASDLYFQNEEQAGDFALTERDREKAAAFYDELLKRGLLDSFYQGFATEYLRTGRRTVGCVFRYRGLFLAPGGYVYICQRSRGLHLGSLARGTLGEILFSESSLKLRDSIADLCRTCGSNCLVYKARRPKGFAAKMADRVLKTMKPAR